MPTASTQATAYHSQVFREICRRSRGPGRAVPLAGYFTDQGWNRADVLLIVAEPLRHKLIKTYGWRFGKYGPTRTGWDGFRTNFMWSGVSEAVHISARSGGFVVANVSSPPAVVVLAANTHDNAAGVVLLDQVAERAGGHRRRRSARPRP